MYAFSEEDHHEFEKDTACYRSNMIDMLVYTCLAQKDLTPEQKRKIVITPTWYEFDVSKLTQFTASIASYYQHLNQCELQWLQIDFLIIPCYLKKSHFTVFIADLRLQHRKLIYIDPFGTGHGYDQAREQARTFLRNFFPTINVAILGLKIFSKKYQHNPIDCGPLLVENIFSTFKLLETLSDTDCLCDVLEKTITKRRYNEIYYQRLRLEQRIFFTKYGRKYFNFAYDPNVLDVTLVVLENELAKIERGEIQRFAAPASAQSGLDAFDRLFT